MKGSSQKIILLFVFGLWSHAQALPADLQVKSKAKTPGSLVKVKKSSGVPAYDIHLAPQGKIPRLNIGEEPELEFQTLTLSLPAVPAPSKVVINKGNSPKLIEYSAKQTQPLPMVTAKKLSTEAAIKQIPEIKPLKEIAEPSFQETEPKPIQLINMKTQDFKILEGLIFLEYQKSYDLALAYFTELFNDKEYRHEALYHYARAAKERGLNTEARASLLTVANETKQKEWKTHAAQALSEFIELFDVSDMEEIDPLVQSQEIDISTNDAYNFYRAKFYLEKGNLGQVEDALTLIPNNSKYHNDSLLISALSSYRQGKLDSAESHLKELLKKTSREDSIRGVGAITLARIQFQKGQYKEAFKSYLEIDKSHALWLQAMVEQSWAQILSHDYEGAAGNMFSLHTDFFKNAYNPESYVVRTVGYLNLCQFGDSMQALNNMGKRYAPMYGKLEAFQQANKNPNLYETVRNLLKNPNQREVDGLPRSFILELARHPSFINIQKHINNYEDEMTNFNKITINLIQLEKDLLKQQTETNKALSENRMALLESKIPAEKMKQLKENEQRLEKRLFVIKFEYQNVNRARNQIKEVREKSFVRLEKEKAVLRTDLSKVLKSRFDVLSKNLKSILDQTEVLQYEIYSGAGQQLRYQASGGDVNEKDRPQLKPEKDKSTTWKYKGEIWEDEIGHFRSSLKNVCPTDSAS